MPLRRGRTYLLLLTRESGTAPFFLVGGNAGEFAYNSTTRLFTKIDTTASWEDSDFALSLAKIGAGAFPESTPPSWLANPSGPIGSPVVSWSSMANDLGMSPTDVTCPNENLCLFAGEVSPPNPGVVVPAVAVSSGPFSPHGSIVGTTTTFPPSSNASWSFVACSGPDLCVLSSPDGIYATTDPTAADWTLQVAPSPEYSFGQVSCPQPSFCAVASGSGVLVTRSPAGASPAWKYIPSGLGGTPSRLVPLTRALRCGWQRRCHRGWLDRNVYRPSRSCVLARRPNDTSLIRAAQRPIWRERYLVSDLGLLRRGDRRRRTPCLDGPLGRRRNLDRGHQRDHGQPRVRHMHDGGPMLGERSRILRCPWRGTRSRDSRLPAAGGELCFDHVLCHGH